jgi:FtsP/CotA-like multicopper oxidase with cupredoxin domain
MAENSGTFWYHSHVANQRMDGIFGGIIIHKKNSITPGIPLVITDWFQTNSLDLVASNPFGHEGSAMAHCNSEKG